MGFLVSKHVPQDMSEVQQFIDELIALKKVSSQLSSFIFKMITNVDYPYF
ncbi:unnamed protein product [Brugia timori]|uniref:Transcriptional regulator n=1 Tax=Brugia timori TaxID=42155 RepID=A0A0R3QDL3_9BILA|nr:unnamed protein product [Brugia timori]